MAHPALNLETELESQYIAQFPLEVADFLMQQSPAVSAALLKKHNVQHFAKLFEIMPSFIGAQILAHCSPGVAAPLITILSTAKAGEVLACVTVECAEHIKAKLDPSTRAMLDEVMAYPDDCAGNMMDKQFIPFTETMTVAEATKKLKTFAHKKYRVIFCVDDAGVLKSYVHVQDLLFSARTASLKQLAKPLIALANDLDSLSRVTDIMSESKLEDLPVVNYDGKLIGIIRYKMLIENIQDKAATDMQTLVGVSKEERALSSPWVSVKKRLPWLQINLITAFAAAAVVGSFEGLIAKYTALAVLLPVVAGQSGNTGAQALAVTMRGLVLREVRVSQWFKLVGKEALAGLINGLAIAVTTALAVYIWSASLGLSLIIFLAMIASMVIAGMAGAAIPLLLSRFGMDPASSSSIILTTVTDVCGFFSFLGIATALLFLL